MYICMQHMAHCVTLTLFQQWSFSTETQHCKADFPLCYCYMTDSLDQETEEGIKNYTAEPDHFKPIVPDKYVCVLVGFQLAGVWIWSNVTPLVLAGCTIGQRHCSLPFGSVENALCSLKWMEMCRFICVIVHSCCIVAFQGISPYNKLFWICHARFLFIFYSWHR